MRLGALEAGRDAVAAVIEKQRERDVEVGLDPTNLSRASSGGDNQIMNLSRASSGGDNQIVNLSRASSGGDNQIAPTNLSRASSGGESATTRSC